MLYLSSGIAKLLKEFTISPTYANGLCPLCKGLGLTRDVLKAFFPIFLVFVSIVFMLMKEDYLNAVDKFQVRLKQIH
jgi:hypothetical protein